MTVIDLSDRFKSNKSTSKVISNESKVISFDEIKRRSDDYFEQEVKKSVGFKPNTIEDLIAAIGDTDWSWTPLLKSVHFKLNWVETIENICDINKLIYLELLDKSNCLAACESQSSYDSARRIYSEALLDEVKSNAEGFERKVQTGVEYNRFINYIHRIQIRNRLKQFSFMNIGLGQRFKEFSLIELMLFEYYKNSNYIQLSIEQILWRDSYIELNDELTSILRIIYDSCLIYNQTQDTKYLHYGFLHWCRLIRFNLKWLTKYLI